MRSLKRTTCDGSPFLIRLTILVAALLLIAGPLATSSFSQIELFGGYSYLRITSGRPLSPENANGWEAALSSHLLGPFGLEADYSDHYGLSPSVTGFAPGLTQLYGPRFEIGLPHLEPFVHALFGTVRGTEYIQSGCSSAPCPLPERTEDAFGMAFGGGLNVKATHHMWIRVLQVDYIRAQFSNHPQNQVRYSAGIVLRFGRW